MRFVSLFFGLALTLDGALAFVTPHTTLVNRHAVRPLSMATPNNNNQDESSSNSPFQFTSSLTKTTATTVGLWTALSQVSSAAGPDWGVFEGRTGSLLHPIMMGSLLLYSLYTAFLGFQWRRQRTIGSDITQLKATLPDLEGSKTVSQALQAAKAADTTDPSKIAKLEAALSTEQEIAALQQERKDLSAAGPRDRHYRQGALLAGLGTLFAIEGPLNTYARAGKLFPGPHLYVGAGVVSLWAIAVAMVPYMTAGNGTARNIHITANVASLALFAWQLQSGIPILLKVVELTNWP